MKSIEQYKRENDAAARRASFERRARLEKAVASTKVYVDLLKVESSRIADVAEKLEAGLAAARAPSTVPIVGAIGGRAPLPARKEPVAIGTNRMVPVRDQIEMMRGSILPRGEAATLRALIQYPNGLRREQLTILTGYKRSSRDSYLQRLRERGFVDAVGERVTATDAGRAAMPDAAPLPVGAELRDWWLARLPVDRERIDSITGYKRSSRDSYLQRLAGKELVVEPSRGEVRAHAALFDEGGRR